jgi:hypothetical protein
MTRPEAEPHILDLVRSREEAATVALAGMTGDASLCAVSRSGTPHPAVKFHEGAAAALAQVRRLLTREPEVDPVAAVASVRADWDDRNAPLAQRHRDWAAYHAGGLEALDALAEEFGSPA